MRFDKGKLVSFTFTQRTKTVFFAIASGLYCYIEKEAAWNLTFIDITKTTPCSDNILMQSKNGLTWTKNMNGGCIVVTSNFFCIDIEA